MSISPCCIVELLTTELTVLKQQQRLGNDTNKMLDKLEKDLQEKKMEIATLKDKVNICIQGFNMKS